MAQEQVRTWYDRTPPVYHMVEWHKSMCVRYGIDMTQMIMNKLVKNAEKYPAK